MYRRGDPVIVQDPDHRDEYYALIKEDGAGSSLTQRVEIHRVLRYPNQHALMAADVPNSIMPLPYKCICRMRVKRMATREDVENYRAWNYEDSLRSALRHAYEDALARGLVDAQVLRDHMLGKVPRSRAMKISA